MPTILIIDEISTELELLRHQLEAEDFDVVMAEGGTEGRRCVETVRPDLVLLSAHLSGEAGFTVLEHIRASNEYGDLPVIMMSRDTGDRTLARCLSAGANDYVTKPISVIALNARIRSLLQRTGRRIGIERRAAELKKRVMFDPLTGVLRRDAFMTAAGEVFDRAQQPDSRLSVIYLDLDYFKEINDRFGHHVGDEALKATGRTLRETMRERDVCGRMGGDEFAACLPDAHSLEALAVVERIRHRVNQLNAVQDSDGNPVLISISAGIAELYNEPDVETLFIKADMALYEAKHRGRNRAVIREGKLGG